MGYRSAFVTILKFCVFFLLLGSLTGCGNERPAIAPVKKIGIVNPSKGLQPAVDGFFRGMTERGYEEGRTATFMYDGPLGGLDRIGQIVADMKASGVDLVFSMSTPATRKVKEALAGSGIPVVFVHVFSPDTSKIVDSISHPGADITGVKVRGASAKALEWLTQVLPGCRRVYVPYNYKDDAARLSVMDLTAAAEKLEVELVLAELTTAEELTAVLAALPSDVDALWLTHSHLLFSQIDEIIAAATEKGIPVASSTSQHERGVMMSYGEDNFRLGQQASRLADRILRGTPAADMPVETAEYSLGINLVIADKLGISVPESVLHQADFLVR